MQVDLGFLINNDISIPWHFDLDLVYGLSRCICFGTEEDVYCEMKTIKSIVNQHEAVLLEGEIIFLSKKINSSHNIIHAVNLPRCNHHLPSLYIAYIIHITF